MEEIYGTLLSGSCLFQVPSYHPIKEPPFPPISILTYLQRTERKRGREIKQRFTRQMPRAGCAQALSLSRYPSNDFILYPSPFGIS